MPQPLDIICGVIKIFQVVDNTAATLVLPIPFGLNRTLHLNSDMKSHKSKALLIDDNNSSSTTRSNYMEYKSQFGLESEYCDRFELNGSGSLTSNLLEL